MSDMRDTRRLNGGGQDRKLEPQRIEPNVPKAAAPVPAPKPELSAPVSPQSTWDVEDRRKLWQQATNLGDAIYSNDIRNIIRHIVSAIVICGALLFLVYRQQSNFDERIRAEREATVDELKRVHDALYRVDKNLEGEQPEASLHRRQDETEHPAWESDDRATKPVAEARSDRDSRDEAKRWYDRMHGCPNGFGMYALPGADWDEAVISRCFDEWRVIELTSIYGERRYEHFDRVAYPIVKQMKRWSTKRFWEAGRVAEKLRKERGRNLAMDGNAIAAAAKPPRTLVELRQYDDEVIEAYNDDLRVIVVQHLPYAYGARIRVLLHLTPEHHALARNWSKVRIGQLEDAHRNR